MSTDLRGELDALARTQTFSPDPSAWDRGRRARRRSRIARGAAALAVVAAVAGAAALAVRPGPVAPAGDVVNDGDGAIPSVIEPTNGDFEDDWAIGRASVALGGNHLVLVGAEDGRYHRFAVPGIAVALSPDGYRVAWWSGGDATPDGDRILIADLRTGDILRWAHNRGSGARVTTLTWRTDSTQLLWNGRSEGTAAAGLIDVTGPSESPDIEGRYGSRGIPSSSTEEVALPSDGEVTAAPFLRVPADRGGTTGERVDRALPTDLYPDGATVTPVGWVDEDHVVAIIDPPPSDVVERPRLAVFTAPDVAESEWTWREFLPRLPPEATSFAVDLIPDLDGDPGQELTHDFGEASASEEGPNRVPYVLGGLVALLAGVAFLRMMQKQA
ncbi:hypothetical protein [Nocardioides ganghwensis]|jgi:hypothetical protein|uniref:Uncharacterized protein n=1 Tax=Nocardioides ganghwensis TaxID=252230 RepID=A0A4Q2SCX2_9ACTN|nr:hypothetical protein [Nocardioides ganghwensis]MBD3946412.1 hypothetical protein [Nocardioides ganghwensis]RYC03166.1 hypothetical protein EUA07_06300 [Nocardioides ganghwensis]